MNELLSWAVAQVNFLSLRYPEFTLTTLAISQGAVLKAIKSESNERELVASEDVGSTECILKLPQAIILRVEAEGDWRDALLELKREMTATSDQSLLDSRDVERDLLCLRLLLERCKGATSFWHPYISFLPSSYTDPYFWSESDLQLIKGTQLGRGVEDHQPGLERIAYWASRLNILHPGALSTWAMSYEGAKWARSTVWSRSFSIHRLKGVDQPTIALIPVLDMIDHDPNMEVVWGTGPVGAEDFQWQSLSHRFKRGETLRNNYGSSKPNHELILAYGFAIPNNPADVVELRVSSATSEEDDDEAQAQANAEKNCREFIISELSLSRELRLSLPLDNDAFDHLLHSISIHLLPQKTLHGMYSQILHTNPQPSSSHAAQTGNSASLGLNSYESGMHVVPFNQKAKGTSSQPLPPLAPNHKLRALLTLRDLLLPKLQALPSIAHPNLNTPHTLLAKTYIDGLRNIITAHLGTILEQTSSLLLMAESNVKCRLFTGRDQASEIPLHFLTALDHIEDHSSFLNRSTKSADLGWTLRECLVLPAEPSSQQSAVAPAHPNKIEDPWPTASLSFRAAPGGIKPVKDGSLEAKEEINGATEASNGSLLPPGLASSLGLNKWVKIEGLALSMGVVIESKEGRGEVCPPGTTLVEIDHEFCLIGGDTKSLILVLMVTAHNLLSKIIESGGAQKSKGQDAAKEGQGQGWVEELAPKDRLVLHLMRTMGNVAAVRYSSEELLMDLLDDSVLGNSFRDLMEDLHEQHEALAKSCLTASSGNELECHVLCCETSFSLFAWAFTVTKQCSVCLPSSNLAIVPIISSAPKHLRVAAFVVDELEGRIRVKSSCALRSKQHLSPSSLIAIECINDLLKVYGPEVIPWASSMIQEDFGSMHWSSIEMTPDLSDTDGPMRQDRLRLLSGLGLGLAHEIKDTRTMKIVLTAMHVATAGDDLFSHPLVAKALGRDRGDTEVDLSGEERRGLIAEMGSMPEMVSQLEQVVRDTRKHTRRRLRQMETTSAGEERLTNGAMWEGTRLYLEDLATQMEVWIKSLEGDKPRSAKRQKKH